METGSVPRLRVLGMLDLEGEGGHEAARLLLAKPRLTALTVYLLLDRSGKWHRRDSLTAMFWPEADQARARASLSQALYQLRQHLGPDSIETRGTEEVRLSSEAVACDAADVKQALADGEDRRACGVYHGGLLPAFHLSNAPEFEHWLDTERAALRTAVLDAAWRSAATAEREEDFSAAGECYRLAGDLALLDSAAVARAMAGLSRAGEATAALALFDRHATAVRTELEGQVDTAVEALAKEIREVGSGAVRSLDTRPKAAIVADGVAVPSPSHQRRLRGPAAVALLAVAGATVVLMSQTSTFRRAPASDPTAIAVLPFAYRGADTADRWIARALPVSLVPLLDGTGGVHAVPESRMSPLLAERGITWDDEVSATDASELTHRLGAGLYLTGLVLHDRGTRYVTATLTDARSGDERQTVWLSLDSLTVVEAVERLADELLIGLVDQQARTGELLSHSSVALRAYVDGWAARRAKQYVEAVRQFRLAMEADSAFALAALGYREAAMWLPDGSPENLALEQADSMLVRWHDRLNGPDRALADAILQTYRMDVDGRDALATLRRATLVASDRPSAWLLFGDFLLHDGRMLALPDFTARAKAAFDSVRALGSLLPEAERHTVEIHYARGDTSAARQYLDLHPSDTAAFDHLRWVAAWLVHDSAELKAYGARLDGGPPATWRWMILWSQRAGVGFDHADRAATLLASYTPLDDERRIYDGGLVRFYLANRGRPHAAARFPRVRFAEPQVQSIDQLELALGLPESWADLDGAARALQDEFEGLPRRDRLWAACHLGAWHALGGRAGTAGSLARMLSEWNDDPDPRRRSMSAVCPTVIRALADTAADLHQLRQADSVLLREPAGTLRTDLTLWSLLVARAYREQGRPELGLPLTTRRGFIVENSAYATAALLLEGDLSLAVGDSARAARAYAQASRFLSRPEPALEKVAGEVRQLARTLAHAACGGDCGAYRP